MSNENRFISDTPTQAHLLHWFFVGGCNRKDPNGNRLPTTSDGTRSDHKHRTFYLKDLNSEDQKGSTDSREWTTYYHAYPNDVGGVTIQYWNFYASIVRQKFIGLSQGRPWAFPVHISIWSKGA
jgi:hypothetical protein